MVGIFENKKYEDRFEFNFVLYFPFADYCILSVFFIFSVISWVVKLDFII